MAHLLGSGLEAFSIGDTWQSEPQRVLFRLSVNTPDGRRKTGKASTNLRLNSILHGLPNGRLEDVRFPNADRWGTIQAQ